MLLLVVVLVTVGVVRGDVLEVNLVVMGVVPSQVNRVWAVEGVGVVQFQPPQVKTVKQLL